MKREMQKISKEIKYKNFSYVFLFKLCRYNDIERCRRIWTIWGEWGVEIGMKINPDKSKEIRLTRTRVKNPLGNSTGDQIFPEASKCKFWGIIIPHISTYEAI